MMLHHDLVYYGKLSAAHWAANRAAMSSNVLVQLNDGTAEVRVIMTPIEAIELAESLLAHATSSLRELPKNDWQSWEEYWKARESGL